MRYTTAKQPTLNPAIPELQLVLIRISLFEFLSSLTGVVSEMSACPFVSAAIHSVERVLPPVGARPMSTL